MTESTQKWETMVSDTQDRLYPGPGLGQFDPSFAMYDGSLQQRFAGVSGPPTHFDGVAFWYRPDPQETVYDHNTMLYNQNMPTANSPVEQPISIKHRRTRSGCFTCRHRRVKCDETRPICERCKKGNRDCQFPQPSTSSRRVDHSDPRNSHKSSLQEAKSEVSQLISAVDEESEESKEVAGSPVSRSSRPTTSTPPISKSTRAGIRRMIRRGSSTVEIKEEQSPQSDETTSPGSQSNTSPVCSRPPVPSFKWRHLGPAIQQYLQYHHDHITRYHCFLKLDPDDFIHTELIDIALSFEPLLYAIVAFAAYHHTLGKPNGRFQEFWKYYCESIRLLRQWLETHTDRNEAALLTILQLVTFEEYLGDWVSLSSHQKAAHSIFTTLYTYDNIMATATSRCIFDWLARADVAVSIMSGAPPSLERRWFAVALEWHRAQATPFPPEAAIALPCFVAELHLVGFDMAAVFSNVTSDPNTVEGIIKSMSKRMDDLRLEIQALHTTTHTSRRITRGDKTAVTPEDAFDPRIPLFRGDLWPLNFVWVDWYATEQMLKYQTMLYDQGVQARTQARTRSRQSPTSSDNASLQSLAPELEKLSLIQCQIFEAIERHPRAPSGAILGCRSALSLASVFLRKTPKYTMWARRKLANIERLGYIWPPEFRRRMAQLWDDKDVLDWWLPSGEHKIALLEEIRGVVEERNKEIEKRGGDERDDVREMKAVFDKLDFRKSGLRTRRDSVWSAAGAQQTRSSSPEEPQDSEDDDNDDDDDDSEEDLDEEQEQHRRESRDSGVGNPNNAGLTIASASGSRRGQPILEYSNRMSGIWEEPPNGGQ